VDDFLQLLLNGPMVIIIPLIITAGLVWVIYYFVFPIIDKNEKLLEENQKLNEIINTDIKRIQLDLDNINKSIVSNDNKKEIEELEYDVRILVKDYPKIEGEITKVISKINEIKDYLSASRRNIDNTSQIIGILKSLESLERSIEIIKERQITQAGVLSSISNSMSSNILNKH